MNPKLRTMITLIALIATLFCCASVAVSEVTELTDQTVDTAVILDLGQQPTSYTVIIPPTVDLSKTDGTGSATVTLKNGFVLSDINFLAVYVEGYETNEANGSYINLTNSANNTSIVCKLRYENGSNLGEGSLIYVDTRSSNADDTSVKILFDAPVTPGYGKYTGTLTFSVITQ